MSGVLSGTLGHDTRVVMNSNTSLLILFVSANDSPYVSADTITFTMILASLRANTVVFIMILELLSEDTVFCSPRFKCFWYS